MHKKLLYIFTFLLGVYDSNGQTKDPINTDRPDQTDGTYTLSKKYYQLETGFTFRKEESNYAFHNTMLRYGLTSKTELRLLLDYGKENSEYGIMPVGISFKHQLVSQQGLRPDITAVGYVRLPFLATSKFKPDKVPATLLLAFQNKVSDKFLVAYNLGSSFDGMSSDPNFNFTTSLSLTPTKMLSFFAEYFSQFSASTNPDHNIDAGVLW